MIKINKLLINLIFISLILAPFDGLNINWFGIMQNGFFFPTLIGILIYYSTLTKNPIIYYNKIFIALFIWIIFSLISVAINLDNIIGVEFKGRSAESSMFSMYVSLVFIAIWIIYYFNILIKIDNIINWAYKGIKYSFYIVSIYGIIELMVLMDIDIAKNIYNLTQNYINSQLSAILNAYEVETTNPELFRVYGVSMEASDFGNYMTIIFPWLILGNILYKKDYLLKGLIILSVILVFFSYSRIAYIGIFLELIYLIISLGFINKYKLGFIVLVVISLITLINSEEIGERFVSVIFSFSEEASIGSMTSNITRIGLQYTAFNMFLSNPIFGVGIGQFNFNMVDFVPVWAYLSPEIQEATNSGSTFSFLGTFNTHLRVLAETGILGFVYWIYIIYRGFKNYIFALKNIDVEKKYIIKCIILSYIASLIGFINYDRYVFFYYWFLVILSEVIVYKIRKNEFII